MKNKKLIKLLQLVLGILYTFIILRMTLIGRSVYQNHIFYGLFWELHHHMWGDIVKNVILFVPLGFIIGDWKGIIICFLLSCGIEVAQYYTCLGFCELDDIMNNTFGAIIGTLLFKMFNCYSYHFIKKK